MKISSIFFMFFILSVSLDAQKIMTSDLQTTPPPGDTEYMYIQPITTEKAPLIEVVEPEQPLDTDKDGILDTDDQCPNSKMGEKVDNTGCLILNDTDNDGVSDKDDKCLNTKAGIAVDELGCELDSDEDGIVDSQDQCPGTSTEFTVDGYGCPQTATLSVTFPPNRYDVDEKLISQLQDFALFLRENPGYDVVIYGYTDSVGPAKVNQILSQKRADAVKEALTRYSISSIRLTAIGKGEADPVADNKTKEGRAQNRRIEVELLQ